MQDLLIGFFVHLQNNSAIGHYFKKINRKFDNIVTFLQFIRLSSIERKNGWHFPIRVVE